ncbi:MAG: glycosyltransferase [Planctomycetes bacterium]|nr:glycosyltransferase [Planctomycetota bacterium]
MTSVHSICVVANTRLPSQRAQALQVTQMSAAFQRAGARTTVLFAQRRRALELPLGVDVFEWYGVPPGPRPQLVPVPCTDWIERVPRMLQYVPARLQEQSFARNAARVIRREHSGARVLSREIETAARLVSGGAERVYLEIHRVPGGRLRRRALLGAADGVLGILAISNGVREDLEKLGIERAKISVEHDAFEAARFRELEPKQAARAALDLPRDVPLVVYTGGLLDWKGVDVLIAAAKTLPDVYFAIAGGMDADVARLRQRAGGLLNVRLDGFQAPERVQLYLAAGDVGVVPNRSQPEISARYTSPLKVFEAMAAGLPLVVSDLPSLREILAPGEEAVFVAADDAGALARGIQELLADPSRRASMSQRLVARAPLHTWDARATRVLAWMDACEGGAKPSTSPPERR